MKGLQEYIKEHGRHFTVELACDVVCKKWDAKQIEKAAQSKVYYNVTESTLGDIVYLVNSYKHLFGCKTKRECITYALILVEDYSTTRRNPFDWWVEETEDFDLTLYI